MTAMAYLVATDFPFCPRFTGIDAIFADETHNIRKCMLTVVAALLTSDGLERSIEDLSGMTSYSHKKIAQALRKLEMYKFIMEDPDTPLHYRVTGFHEDYLWLRDGNTNFETLALDMDILNKKFERNKGTL